MEDTIELSCKRGVFGLKSWDPLRPPYTWIKQQPLPINSLPSQNDGDKGRPTDKPIQESVFTLDSTKVPVGPEQILDRNRSDPAESVTRVEEVMSKYAYRCSTTSPPDDDTLSQQGGTVNTGSGDDELFWIDRSPVVDKVDTIQHVEHTNSPTQSEKDDDLVLVKSDAEPPPPAPDKLPEIPPPTPNPGKRYLCKLCQERMVGHATFRQHEQSALHKKRVTAYWRMQCSVM